MKNGQHMHPRHYNILLISLLIFCSTLDCFARAGGGGGGSPGGSEGGIVTTILAFVLAPFFIFHSAVMAIMFERKRNKARELVEQLGKTDNLWNLRLIKARVEETFFKVQKAWSERNQDLAKDYMSRRIYVKHKLQTDEMIEKGTKNVLERVNLEDVSLFSVSDYKDDSHDSFSVRIKGSTIDYHIDVKTGKVISGDNSQPESFTEIWTFIRIGNNWFLDEIDQKVTFSDIKYGKAFTEI